eukprot:298177_1
MVVFTGLTAKLLFGSLETHFECPLSTTTEISVANSFSNGIGIILELVAANPKARYFNVSWLSPHKNESERLFMGSTLKIVDIYIHTQSAAKYISALHMFEQIIDGKFIDGDIKVERTLLSLMLFVLNDNESHTFTDKLLKTIKNDNKLNEHWFEIQHFLSGESYDTDSILYDIHTYEHDEQSSNIVNIIRSKNSVSTIRKCIARYRFTTSEAYKYIIALFKNMISKMQQYSISNSLWINMHELENIQTKQLKYLLVGTNTFFEHYHIEKSNVNIVQQYEWMITGDAYAEFKNFKPKQYIKSEKYEYKIDDEKQFNFHLEVCAQYSDVEQNCALFFHLDSLPEKIEAIRVEFDVFCTIKSNFRQIMCPWLSDEKRYSGFQTFASGSLKNNNSILWKIGLKAIKFRTKDEYQIKIEFI